MNRTAPSHRAGAIPRALHNRKIDHFPDGGEPRRGAPPDRAQRSWRQNKAPMAAYWKAVSVYAGHLHRVVRPTKAELAMLDLEHSPVHKHLPSRSLEGV